MRRWGRTAVGLLTLTMYAGAIYAAMAGQPIAIVVLLVAPLLLFTFVLWRCPHPLIDDDDGGGNVQVV